MALNKDNPIATYALTNNTSVNILKIEYGIEDFIFYVFGGTDKKQKVKRSPIRYDDGSPYFLANKIEVPLSDCIKIGE